MLISPRTGRLPETCRHAIAALGLLGLVLAGCKEANQFQPPPPPKVTVAQPLVQSVTNYLEETGTTEAVDRVDVRARVMGFLEEIRFEPGTLVNEGDVLYVIERDKYAAQVASAQAALDASKTELERAEIEYDRQQRLITDNATSEQQVVLARAQQQEAESAVAAAEAELNLAELDLEYTEVRAPIGGRVGKTLVKVGNLVGDGEATHLTTIVQYDPIYANFNISELSLLELLEGKEAEAEADSRPDIKLELRRGIDDEYRFHGRFDYADLAVDQSTGTYAIRGVFANPQLELVPGLFVQVRLPVGTTEGALLVPERAIGTSQFGRYLYVVDESNIVQRHEVMPGIKVGEMIVVTGEISSDDWVITDGIQFVRPESEVQPERADLAASDADAQLATPDIVNVPAESDTEAGDDETRELPNDASTDDASP